MPDKNFKNEFTSILDSILLIEYRFSEIKRSEDFASSPEGLLILDSIAMRLQIIGEQLKAFINWKKLILTDFGKLSGKKL